MSPLSRQSIHLFFELLRPIVRSVGLNVFNFILDRLSNRVEPKKNVVSTSFWVAFSRCWVHILPVSISIFLIQLKVRGHYLGQHLRGPTSNDQEDSVALAFIQVAAKLLELLIVASLAAVVFQVIRDGLLHEDGIPFGIATSGFSFDRMQYFWSPPLWGGLWGFRKSRKFRGMLLLCVIALSGSIALVAGPASAVLLLPRITTWNLFETRAWLNGTNDQFWPENLTGDHIGGDQCRWSPGIYCVNKLLPYLLTYYSISQNAWGYQISPPEQKYPRILEGTPREPGVSAEAWSIAPHAATSFLLGSLWYDPWWYPMDGKHTGVVSGEIVSKAAAVRTVCSRDVKSFDRNTPSIPLPLLSEYSTWAPNNGTEGPYVNVSFPRSRWETGMMANRDTVTTVWIPPSVNMTSVTVGLVVFGQQVVNSSQRNGVVCSIDARWNRAKHVSTKSVWYGLGNQGNTISAQLSSQHTPESTINGPLPIKNEENWRHISAEIEWFNTLSYSVPANGGNISETEWLNTLGYGVSANGGNAYSSEFIRVNTTYLGNILLTQIRPDNISATPWDPQHTTTIETVISTVMADAISGIGLAHLWSTPTIPVDFADNCSYNAISGSHPLCPPPSLNDKEMIQLTFNGSLTDYAYKASRPTDYVSIAVLSVYIFIAFAHILRLLSTRRSSVCWDTVEELVLLAKTSDSRTEGTPLKNTSAGISLFPTMALRNRIRGRAADERKEGQEELQLLIEKDFSRDDGTQEVKDGKEYGMVDRKRPSQTTFK